MLVEVKGVHFENQGAHLMLVAVLERLRSIAPHASVVLATGPNSTAERVEALGALRKLRLRKRWIDLNGLGYAWPAAVSRALLRRGVAAEGQVDAVLDASGFAYGGDWTPWLMTYAADEIRRLAARKRPYIFLPQAFGPFPESGAAAGFGAALEKAALVCVRDDESARHLAALNSRLEHRLARFPDLTIGLHGDSAAAARWGVDERTVLLIPNRQMTGASNREHAWRTGYVAFMADVAARVRALGCRVALLNHGGSADRPLCENIAREAGDIAVVDEPDPRAVKGVIGAAAAVVCSRFHGCVAALSQGVPCLGTSWSHKYQALFDEFAVPGWLVGKPDAREAAVLLEGLLAARAAHSAALRARAGRLEAQVEEMWQRVAQALVASSGVETRP